MSKNSFGSSTTTDIASKTSIGQEILLPPKFIAYHPLKSIKYASEGLLLGFQREANLRIQFILGLSSCLIFLLTKFYALALGTLIMMFITMSMELINTAVETLCDLLHPDYHPKIKIIKDMSAAAVWMASLAWLTVLVYGFYSIVTPSIMQIF